METNKTIPLNREFVGSLIDTCVFLSITTIGAYFIGKRVGYRRSIRKGIAVEYVIIDRSKYEVVTTSVKF